MNRTLGILATLGLALGGCVSSQATKIEEEIDRVPAGETTFLQRTFMTMNESCRATKRPTATITEAPKHGRVQMVAQSAAAIYGPGPYEHCDGKIGSALAFKYTSRPGYRGAESFAVRVRYADGEIRPARYNIDVY